MQIPPPHHLGELVHLLHGGDDLLVEVLDLLPGVVRQGDQATAAFAAALPLAVRVHTAQAATRGVGAGLGPGGAAACLGGGELVTW